MSRLPIAWGAAMGLVILWGAPTPARADCTATIDCHNGCFASIEECPPPFLPAPLFCSLASQTLSCSGPNANSQCNSTSSSVTCDGVTQTCATQTCSSTATSVHCGTVTKFCKQCPPPQIRC